MDKHPTLVNRLPLLGGNYCSFCGEPADKDCKLATEATSTVFICKECVWACVSVFRQQEKEDEHSKLIEEKVE